jgi:hypothetical protein
MSDHQGDERSREELRSRHEGPCGAPVPPELSERRGRSDT